MSSKNIILVIFSVYIILLSLGAIFRGRELGSRYSSFLKCFFPNWRFFEDVLPIPLLYFRWGRSEDQFSDWILATPSRKRDLTALLLNSKGNLALAKASLVEAFVIAVNETSSGTETDLIKIKNLTEFKMIQSWIKNEVQMLSGFRAKNPTKGILHYQFKVESHRYLQNPELLMQSVSLTVEEQCV